MKDDHPSPKPRQRRGPKVRFPQSVTVSFRVPQDHWNVAARIAEKEGVSLADAHRLIYERGVLATERLGIKSQEVAVVALESTPTPA